MSDISAPSYPSKVGEIVDGKTTFSKDSLGAIIENLTKRTDYLKSALDNTQQNSEYGQTLVDTGFSPDCEKGMLIARDHDTGLYIPALATYTNYFREDGTAIPADSAKVIGVLLELDEDTGTGRILVRGCTTDTDIIDYLVGDGAAGDYYLSKEIKGKAYKSTYAEISVSAYCFTCLYNTDTKVRTLFVCPDHPIYNGTSEVRRVLIETGNNPPLSVKTENGEVTLSMNTESTLSAATDGVAVVGVNSDGFIKSPVVNSITGAVGVTVTKTKGEYEISANSELRKEQDLNLTALDGVYLSTTANNTLVYTFPALVDSSMLGVMRAPYIEDSSKVYGELRILVQGSGTGHVSGLSDVYITQVAPVKKEEKSTDLISESPFTVPTESTVDTSKGYLISVPLTGITISSNSLLYVKLRARNPNYTTRVLAVSLKVNHIGEDDNADN